MRCAPFPSQCAHIVSSNATVFTGRISRHRNTVENKTTFGIEPNKAITQCAFAITSIPVGQRANGRCMKHAPRHRAHLRNRQVRPSRSQIQHATPNSLAERRVAGLKPLARSQTRSAIIQGALFFAACAPRSIQASHSARPSPRVAEVRITSMAGLTRRALATV